MSNNVKKLEVSGRLFFVSDVHGELPTLLYGLKELGFDEKVDTCIHAGDLIDRGRFSFETACHFLAENNKNFHSVLGNHDVFTFQGDDRLWVYNGGTWAFTELDDQERYFLGKSLLKLPYAIEVTHNNTTYGVTHAGIPVELSWQEFLEALTKDNPAAKQEVVWMRDIVQYKDFYSSDHSGVVRGVDFTIHGHTPVKDPLMVGNRLHIDTGLVYNKHLTITEALGDGKFLHHSFDLQEKNDA